MIITENMPEEVIIQITGTGTQLYGLSNYGALYSKECESNVYSQDPVFTWKLVISEI
jgi:hypothetical protein